MPRRKRRHQSQHAGCFGPPFLVWWSTKARALYGSGLAIGLAALLLTLRLRERDSKWDAALLGFVLGLGVWATLQSMLLALPALVWLAWRRAAAYRLAPFALPGLLLGSSPWLAWNVRHDWNAVVPRSVAGEKRGQPLRVVLIREALVRAARVRRIASSLLQQRAERFVAWAWPPLFDVDSRRHLVDAVDVAANVL